MIRVAVIGCGKIAQVRHLPEYATNPNAQLVAYYDKNSQRAHEVAAQYGGKVYDSYFDLLKDPEIDAVSVCVENRSHAEMTTAALYAGKHVLCEKPMAVTLAECESMVAAAEFNNRHLMIGHNMRFDPVHRRAKELLEQGVIGDVITFRTGLGTSGPEGWSMEGNWFFDKKKGRYGRSVGSGYPQDRSDAVSDGADGYRNHRQDPDPQQARPGGSPHRRGRTTPCASCG